MRVLTGVVCAAAVMLAACGEKPQNLSPKKGDVRASEGTGAAAYMAPGWKAGDATSWETQMRNRAQSQTEYSRSGSAP